MALDKTDAPGRTADTQENYDEGLGRDVAQSIGVQVRVARNRHGMTVARVAQLTGLSSGMLSKVENGNAFPSLTTLHALSRVFRVPMTFFFETHQETRGCCYVKKDGGLFIESRGSKVGHQYQLLGHGVGKELSVSPYMIELNDTSEVFPLFQHPGVEFIHMLGGEMVYEHGGKPYRLSPGDSLFFEGTTAHGPVELIELPIRFLSLIVEPGPKDGA
ncbi:helix-turn-helix domain-containing protein [Methyloceanibacter caenitepidi]|uniref:Transcriptional regulator n=1 Tax=Methyloceanibacter caenitepidi TaxID=1384459 RepID=A0A0A8K559_9HYPH|nr:XRE family transcriptional regulator [Methyloceanibacter caenitepidi]BAQ18088.1 transcriptional regulator [Methyloceanibacter caenitepidi]